MVDGGRSVYVTFSRSRCGVGWLDDWVGLGSAVVYYSGIPIYINLKCMRDVRRWMRLPGGVELS